MEECDVCLKPFKIKDKAYGITEGHIEKMPCYSLGGDTLGFFINFDVPYEFVICPECYKKIDNFIQTLIERRQNNG